MHLDPRQKLILFDCNGTLGAKKGAALHPGIESLEKLQTAGYASYAIGTWSNASRENIPLDKMVEVRPLFLGRADRYLEPTVEYRHFHQLAHYEKLKR